MEYISESDIKQYINNNIENKKPTNDVLKKYRNKIGGGWSKYLTLDTINGLPNRTIVFISDRPNYYFLRVADSLRNKKVHTILITRWGVEKRQLEYFDDILLYDSLLDLYVLKHIQNTVIYVQAWVGWFFLPVFIDIITEVNIICNVNDSSIMLFDNLQHFEHIGLDNEEAQFDIHCEKYIYNNLPLVTTPYENNSVIHRDHNTPNNIPFFPCYPNSKFCRNISQKPNDALNLLFIGGVPIDKKPDIIFKDAKIQHLIKTISESKLRLTIYNSPQIAASLSNNDLEKNYNYIYNLSKFSNNIKFQTGYTPWELKQHAHRFSFGLMIYDFSDIIVSKNHYSNIIPTKVFTYIEMGLPIIVSDEMEAVANYVIKYNLGIVVNKNSTSKLEEIIIDHSYEYDTYICSIRNFQLRKNMYLEFNELYHSNIKQLF
jgi:hypothetical protein